MSLLSVAPSSFTWMFTIPKLIAPLQMALAMRPPEGSAPVFHTKAGYPHCYQHKLFINNNLRRRIIYNERGRRSGMYHRQVQGFGEDSLPPPTALRIRFIAESPRWRGVGTSDSELASEGND